MKASDLRIGNWLHSNITNIDFELEIGTLSTMIIYGNETGKRIWISPIPLSEEWLIKFDWNGYNYLHIGSYFNIDSVGHLYYRSDYTGINIHYVHQLQNLYFALCGEELTIKEPIKE